MKRFLRIFLPVILLLSLALPAAAVSEAASVSSQHTVQSDGSCHVAVSMQLHLDGAVEELRFPLPADSRDARVNGAAASILQQGGQAYVLLPVRSAGDHSITLEYTLSDVVSRSGGVALVTVPLLSGFAYPIRQMEFSVTLPGDITAQPGFVSGYHQENIAGMLETTVSGSTVFVKVQQGLKDHETLEMTLEAEESLFPRIIVMDILLDGWDAAILGCILLAVVYYLLTLMPRIYRRSRCFTAPEAISAGEVGTCLTGAGADLTLMVFTWAQLGYIQIHYQSRQRVVLHKRMEMGNERSQFEIRTFQALFKNRTAVDGTSMYYARLCRKVASKAPMLPLLFRPNSGRPLIFSLLACAAGAISGVKLGLALSGNTTVQVLLAILLCAVCGAFSYWIQAGGKCLPLRDKMPLWIALGCSALWLALGYLAGKWVLTVPMVLFQLAAGVGIAFGGRRSELGKRSLSQISGLRQYMLRANAFELQQRLQANSSYFYELAPYALALGVDKRFARRFGKVNLPDCSFLTTGGSHPDTAFQWALVLRQTADALNAQQRRLRYGNFRIHK